MTATVTRPPTLRFATRAEGYNTAVREHVAAIDALIETGRC